MSIPRLGRRRVLTAAGIGAATLVAGCVSDDRSDGTAAIAPADDENTTPTDEATLYRRKIDSVPLIRAFGIETGNGRREGGSVGQGSGFVFDDRFVVTNEHVISGADEVDLQYTSAEWSRAQIVGTDVRSDLAVLEPDYIPEAATSFVFSEREPVVGHEVKAIGNPLGLEGSLSTGVVSGIDRSVFSPMTGVSIPHAVQTDAAINPGNSGGPLIDADGKVIGVIGAGGGENIGFAISAPLSRRVVFALIEVGDYEHAFLGANFVGMDPVVADANGRSEPFGVLVTDVDPDGPAGEILRSSDDRVVRHDVAVPVGGDVLLEIEGEPVDADWMVTKFLALETSPGDEIELTIDRGDQVERVGVTLASTPAA